MHVAELLFTVSHCAPQPPQFVTVVVAVDQRWSTARTTWALLSAVPPFCTVVFDLVVERRGAFTGSWRLTAPPASPSSPASVEPGRLDRPVGWLLRHPGRGALVGLAAVAVLTVLALLVGPPASGG